MSKGKIERIERITHLSPEPAIGIWFQGCSFNCPGCINEHLQNVEEVREVSIDEIMLDIQNLVIKHGDIQYIVYSGGEPLEQEEFLTKLSQTLKHKYPYMLQVLFTGFELDEKTDYLLDVKNDIDFKLCGRYKGSDNGISDKTFIMLDDGVDERLPKLNDFYKELAKSNVVEAIIKNDSTVITGFSYVEE